MVFCKFYLGWNGPVVVHPSKSDLPEEERVPLSEGLRVDRVPLAVQREFLVDGMGLVVLEGKNIR